YETGGSLFGVIEYSTDLFEHATIERAAAHFQTLLQAAVAKPESRIGDLSLLTPGERQIIFDWTGDVDANRAFPLVHRLFEEHSRNNPENVAVAAERLITYAELDTEADGLAALLTSRGAGPEKLIGICMPRCWQLVLSELAALKSGAAFLPIDPGHPKE